jgi:hypothetical protein
LNITVIIRLFAIAANEVFVQKEFDQRFLLIIILPIILELEDKILPIYAIPDIEAEGKGFIDQN